MTWLVYRAVFVLSWCYQLTACMIKVGIEDETGRREEARIRRNQGYLKKWELDHSLSDCLQNIGPGLASEHTIWPRDTRLEPHSQKGPPTLKSRPGTPTGVDGDVYLL
jgi:hypothetical protein